MAAPAPRSSSSSTTTPLALGVLIAVAHIANLLWWNTAYNRGADQAERVVIYREGLPSLLGGMTISGATWLLAGLALLGVLLAVPASRRGPRPLSVAGKLVAAVNGLFLLWYLFTLM